MGAGSRMAKLQPHPLGGTGWKGHSYFLLGELSARLLFCVGGSLQPRVQDRAVALREQQPTELKAEPKGAAGHYNSACPAAEGLGPPFGCFHYSSTAPPRNMLAKKKKLCAFLEFVFCSCSSFKQLPRAPAEHQHWQEKTYSVCPGEHF